jgi:hypothetical protein
MMVGGTLNGPRSHWSATYEWYEMTWILSVPQ